MFLVGREKTLEFPEGIKLLIIKDQQIFVLECHLFKTLFSEKDVYMKMVLDRALFFFPNCPVSRFDFITIAATIFFNMNLQASIISFFVHQTVQNTIQLQGRQIFVS